MSDTKLPIHLPQDLRQIINESGHEQYEKLVQYILSNTELRPQLEVSTLWDQPEFAGSFWIYLMNGTELKEESDIAKSLLFWKAMSVNDKAKVICYQTSDYEFSYCSTVFNVQKYPALLLGTSPDMPKVIRFSSDILREVVKEEGKLQKFLNEIHFSIVNGNKTLEEINKDLVNDKIIKGLKTAYAELKSLITVTLKAGI